MKHLPSSSVILSSILSVLVVSTTGCSKASVKTVSRLGQSDTPGATPKPPGTPSTLHPVAPAVAYDSVCENANGGAFGLSRRFSVRLYSALGCPVGESEKSEAVCVPNYAFVLERHYFQAADCVGRRSAIVSRTFTMPEAVASATAANEADFKIAAATILPTAINAKSGPVFFRVEGMDLLSLFQLTKFCGNAWENNVNTEVTGLTCGGNDPFLDANTPVYTLWTRTENTLQFGALALDSSSRPKALDPTLLFHLR